MLSIFSFKIDLFAWGKKCHTLHGFSNVFRQQFHTISTFFSPLKEFKNWKMLSKNKIIVLVSYWKSAETCWVFYIAWLKFLFKFSGNTCVSEIIMWWILHVRLILFHAKGEVKFMSRISFHILLHTMVAQTSGTGFLSNDFIGSSMRWLKLMLASLFSTYLKYSMFTTNPYAVGFKPFREMFP